MEAYTNIDHNEIIQFESLKFVHVGQICSKSNHWGLYQMLDKEPEENYG